MSTKVLNPFRGPLNGIVLKRSVVKTIKENPKAFFKYMGHNVAVLKIVAVEGVEDFYSPGKDRQVEVYYRRDRVVGNINETFKVAFPMDDVLYWANNFQLLQFIDNEPS